MSPIKNSFTIQIIFIVLSLIGFTLLPLLSVQLLPTSKAHQLTINYAWPNAAPTVIEQTITTPLEGAFNLINGVKKVYSVSRKGSGYIRLDLDKNTDLAMLRFEIATKIRQVYPKLPKGVSYPTIRVQNPEKDKAKRPILTYSLGGPYNATELYQYAKETLSPPLALTDGIQQIEVQGGNEMEWVIRYDDALCAILGVQRGEILKALQEYFKEEALGIVVDKEHYFFVRMENKNKPNIPLGNTHLPPAKAKHFKGGMTPNQKKNINGSANSFIDASMLERIVLKKVGQMIIKLGNVATVQQQESPPRSHYRINGQNSIRLLFFPEQQVNTIRLAQLIKRQIKELQADLPKGYELYLDDDSTEFLGKELNKIGQRTGLSIAILLLFILFIYRSVRHLGIIFFSLIANLGLAFILYYWLGVELHLYALAGITVSFGIIIDNTLVMVHHLRHRGNLSVFPALLASTLTTLASLVIIFFLPEEWQLNLVEFAKVIGINLGVSLLVAGVLIPTLVGKKHVPKDIPLGTTHLSPAKAKRFKGGNPNRTTFSKGRNLRRVVKWQNRYKKMLTFLLNWRNTAVVLIILTFGLPVFMLPNKIEEWDWYNHSLGNEWYIENVKPQVNKWLGGTLRLFVWYVYEGANYQQPEETILTIQGSMPNGATLEQMNTVFGQIEAYLAQFPNEVKQYVSNVYNGQFAQTRIYFNPEYDSSFPHQLKNQLIAFTVNLGGAEWQVYGVGNSFKNGSGFLLPPYRLKMYGYNKGQLNQQAEIMSQKLERHPRVKKVNTAANIDWWIKDLYEYQLDLNKERMTEKKIHPLQLQPIFANFNQSIYPDLYTPQQKGIKLISKRLKKNDLWVLQNRPIRLNSQFIDFSDISQLKKQKVVGAIHKENQQYIQLLEWEYTGAARFGNRHLDKCQSEMEKELPLGYIMEQVGFGIWDQKDKKQYALFLLILGLIFIICAIQFESFQQAFVIILLVPISFIGIFLTFYCFDFNFDQGGYTSFILLSGLVVNGLILIINDFNYYRKCFPKRSFISNYTKAFVQKITPVLLTIISTVLGLLPFLWHGQKEVFWFSLAIGTIGGLLFSVMVLIFFIPLFLKQANQK